MKTYIDNAILDISLEIPLNLLITYMEQYIPLDYMRFVQRKFRNTLVKITMQRDFSVMHARVVIPILDVAVTLLSLTLSSAIEPSAKVNNAYLLSFKYRRGYLIT